MNAAARQHRLAAARRHARRGRMGLLLCLLCLFTSIPALAQTVLLRDGDLLFVSAGSSGLSAAIDDATAAAGAPGFDHVGLLASDSHGRSVLHADELGSREQPLAQFLQQAHSRQRQVVVYRLKTPEPAVIARAIASARGLLGKPYNATYVPNPDSLYCSDLIERAFRADGIFALQPMNFRNPETGVIAAYWVDFYRSHGMDVPQGLPGTNPNDMAHSPALQRVGTLQQQAAVPLH